ncbi:MAG TPA: PASTA domain-containing protein [Streptosporangiaceae bacterium]
MSDENEARRGERDMSARTMLVLGGIMTVGVAAVLGMTSLVARTGNSTPEVPAAPAAASAQDGGSAAPASRPVRQVAITPHVAVPPTAGLDQRTARVRLRATRLEVAVVLRMPSGLPAGQVVRTEPAAGTGLPAGGRVALYVSTGVPAAVQVTVPYLRGLPPAQARAAAARLGLRVVVSGGHGSVSGQLPPPGAQTPRGAEIAVVLDT